MVLKQNIDTLDTVLTTSLKANSLLLPAILTIIKIVGLFSEDSKCIMLQAAH